MTKKLNRTLTLTAAILTLGAAAAFGQDTLTAKIPFSFRATGAELPAGNYTVAPLSGGKIIQFWNVEARRGAFVPVQNPAESKGGTPRLIFNCGSRGCSLASLWFNASRGLEFSRPRVKEVEDRLVTVNLHRPSSQ